MLEQFVSSSHPHVGEELTVNPKAESILVEYFYSEKSYEQMVDEITRMVSADSAVRHLVDRTREALSNAIQKYNTLGQ